MTPPITSIVVVNGPRAGLARRRRAVGHGGAVESCAALRGGYRVGRAGASAGRD
jgi:hypothetical protein